MLDKTHRRLVFLPHIIYIIRDRRINVPRITSRLFETITLNDLQDFLEDYLDEILTILNGLPELSQVAKDNISKVFEEYKHQRTILEDYRSLSPSYPVPPLIESSSGEVEVPVPQDSSVVEPQNQVNSLWDKFQ